MSGTFPLSPKPSSIVVTSNTPVVSSTSQSGRVLNRRVGSHYWSLACTYDMLTRADYAPIDAFMQRQEGKLGVFQFYSHNLTSPQGTATGKTPLVTIANQVGNSVTTKSWGVNSEVVFKAGDLVKFSGHTKVYKIVADITTSATDTTGGLTNLLISPPLLKSPAADEAVEVSNIPYTVSFMDSNIEYTMNGVDLYQFEVNLREVF